MPVLGPPYVSSTPPAPAPPPAVDSQNLTLWLERDGNRIDLPLTAIDPTHIWCVAPGIEGLDLPATSILEINAAQLHGSFYRGTRVGSREIFLPLMVKAADMTEWFVRRDAYNKITSPYRERPVTIWAQRPDSTLRWIEGFRAGEGPSWDRSTWIMQIAWQKFGATFICPDPWWKGQIYTINWMPSGTPTPFFPITPVKLNASNLFGQPTPITISGDVKVWPKYTVTGPITRMTVTNETTGESWTMIATLAAGETAVINTDPRAGAIAPRVQGPGGVSWWSKIGAAYNLFGLEPGNHRITVALTGVDTSTSATMTATEHWETV